MVGRSLPEEPLSPAEQGLADRVARRGRVFLGLSAAGVAVALGLGAYYVWRRWHDPSFPVGLRAVVIVLVLLNARLNLRQYRLARILARRPR